MLMKEKRHNRRLNVENVELEAQVSHYKEEFDSIRSLKKVGCFKIYQKKLVQNNIFHLFLTQSKNKLFFGRKNHVMRSL